ncbi:MAG: helix-turn-helix domain-containing protein [Paracoccaceae bacterium]
MIGRWAKPAAKEDKPKGFDDFDMRLGDQMRGERATLGKSLLDVQRELKIKATYIAAIENADVAAFETPGFIAGYVRSYARYLGMDPEDSFSRFCAESGFEVAHGMSAAASTASIVAQRARASGLDRGDPFANPNASFFPRPESAFARIEPGAVGSISVLVALLMSIGYGGWWVLQEVQRVQLAPVNEAPAVVAEIDPLGNVAGEPVSVRSAPEDLADAQGTGVSRDPLLLYRPEALSVPVLIARDGPIAAIDPRQSGVLAEGAEPAAAVPAAGDAADGIQVLAETTGVEIMAVRPSWVRVSALDGSVIFEKILDAGEIYSVPPLAQAPVLRAGNSNSVYFLVGGKTFGPAARDAEVVKDLSLDAGSLLAAYQQADPDADADLARFVALIEAPAEGSASE